MRTARQRAAELKRLAATKDQEIDTSDIPEQRDWSGAEVGKFYRPVKTQVTLRIDADVLAWFKAQGGKYQTALNAALREHVARHGRARVRTGEVCPESGVWISEDFPSTTAPIAKGNRMPPHKNKSVYWRLTRYA